ncbi:MAG TPA: GGDEF domain-containing protein [Thiolinea sp.]|nr:GGDEF domain-containing protein [Thiolinea sp.]
MPIRPRPAAAHTLHWVLSPIFAFAIYLAVLNLGSTYFRLENYQREAIWSLVHLNTQLQSTQHDIQLYGLGELAVKSLRTRYELLWSKFDITLNNIEQDNMLGEISGLHQAIDASFDEFKAMESRIYSGETIAPEVLDKWIASLSHSHEIINRFLLHEVADADGSYSKSSWHTLLKSLYLVAAASLLFFVHIGYLLLTLMRERSDNLFQLSHDSLTGLANRNHAMSMLDEFCREHMFFTLAIIDLNEFKQVNDVHGHPAGDQILMHLSNEFRETLSHYGLVGRLGGDEFIWLVNTTDRELVARYFQKLLERLSQPYLLNEHQLYLRLSAGATTCHGDNPNPKSLMAQADAAMYSAKKARSPDISWYKPEQSLEKSLSSIIGIF